MGESDCRKVGKSVTLDLRNNLQAISTMSLYGTTWAGTHPLHMETHTDVDTRM